MSSCTHGCRMNHEKRIKKNGQGCLNPCHKTGDHDTHECKDHEGTRKEERVKITGEFEGSVGCLIS
jgi:hypothetical protein